MDPATINDLLARRPFQPFRVKFANQETADIFDPALVVVMRREIFIADPSRDRFRIHWLMHVVGVDTLQAT